MELTTQNYAFCPVLRHQGQSALKLFDLCDPLRTSPCKRRCGPFDTEPPGKEKSDLSEQEFSVSALYLGPIALCCGVVLCIVGCVAASLATTH